MGHNFAWTLAGNVTYAGCQWGMLVALAKLGGAEITGRFVLGLAITAPVVEFAGLQLRELQATDARGKYRFGDYLGLRTATLALALAVIVGIVAACGYRGEIALVILTIGLAKCVEGVSLQFFGLLQQQERLDLIAVSMMIKGPLSLAALGLGLYFTGSLLVGVAGLLGAWILVLLVYDIPRGAAVARRAKEAGPSTLDLRPPTSDLRPPTTDHRPPTPDLRPPTTDHRPPDQPSALFLIRPRWHLPTLKKLAWLALPLGFVLMLVSLTDNVPRYFISHVLGERALGIFAPIAYLMLVGNLMVDALAQSASPRLAKHHADGERGAFRKLLTVLVVSAALVGAAGVLVALLAGRPILRILYQPEYAEHTDVLLWVMVAAAARHVACVFGFAATAARRLKYQPLALLAVVAATAAACHFLVGPRGLVGGAMAIAVGAAVHALGYAGLLAFGRAEE
jgi:O-antigen/teichoic acid export membrane protein